MGARIYVGNLPPGISERELEDEFIRFGQVRSIWVARKPPGFAFVEYEDNRDAVDAVRRLDGFKGWRVEISRTGSGPRWGGSSTGGSGGGSYRSRSPPRFVRSLSPRRRRSPSYDRYRERSRERRPSPSPRRRSLSPRRRSPSYERTRGASPRKDRYRRRSDSPAARSPARENGRSPSRDRGG